MLRYQCKNFKVILIQTNEMEATPNTITNKTCSNKKFTVMFTGKFYKFTSTYRISQKNCNHWINT